MAAHLHGAQNAACARVTDAEVVGHHPEARAARRHERVVSAPRHKDRDLPK